MSGFSLFPLFRDELLRLQLDLKNLLMQLSVDPSERSRVDQLSRKLHALKGAARVASIIPAEKLATAMEGPLNAVRRGECELHAEQVERMTRASELFEELGAQSEDDVQTWLTAHQMAFTDAIKSLTQAPAPTRGRADISSADNKMLELFASEVEEQSAALGRGLMLLEAQPEQLGLIAPIMRAAHSIKGAARAVRQEQAVRIAHAMEDRLSAMQRGELAISDVAIEVLIACSDHLLAQAKEALALGREPENSKSLALLKRLEALEAQVEERVDLEPAPTPTALLEGTARGTGEMLHIEAAPQGADAGSYIPVANVDAVLKVHASKISELIGMAGQGVVEARRLRPYAERLQRLRRDGVMLSELIDDLHHALGAPTLADPIGARVAELRKRIGESRRALGGWSEEFGEFSREADNLNQRLYRAATATRMRPLRDALLAFPRMARDLAKKLGKKVYLVQQGTHVDVDRDMLERLEAPLTHLLRNAIDHGIELPTVRRALGKAEEGRVRIHADHRAGMLAVEFNDDGAGIDVEKIRSKAIARGLVSQHQGANLDNQALYGFLFQPGFSTTNAVTEVSGRGVGLDVVRDLLHQVNGTCRVQSKLGQGTSFFLSVPISRSITRAMVVLVNAEPYAFPLTRVDRIAQIPTLSVHTVEGRQYVSLEGRNIGLVDLARLLELGEALPEEDQICIVVVERQGRPYGFAVDRFLGEFDLAARALDPRLGQVSDLAGSALLPDGEPVLLLDVDDLLRSAARQERSLKILIAEKGTRIGRRKRVLVVDDSISVRELERQLLSNRGFDVQVAVDGVDGWGQVRESEFDLVITDVDMPRMDGIQLTRSIKQDPRLRNVPVIIVSYRDRQEDRSRGMDARADCYLTKGDFHDETFLRTVLDLVGEPVES